MKVFSGHQDIKDDPALQELECIGEQNVVKITDS